jgi:hypothetical protein
MGLNCGGVRPDALVRMKAVRPYDPFYETISDGGRIYG